MPFPSSGDRWTAAHLGVPIYAITRSNINKADTAGRAVAVVRSRQWWTDPIRETPRLCPYATRGVSIVSDDTPRSVPVDLVEVCGNRFAIANASRYSDCGW